MPQALLERLKKLLHGENAVRLVVVVGMAGLICLLLSSMLPKEEESGEIPEENASSYAAADADPVQLSDAYAHALECRLAEMLMQMEGVGHCRVMITVSGSASYAYAQNAQHHVESAQQEIQREHVILKEDGDETALVEHVQNPDVIGVIIACEGGQDYVVREQIIKAASAVLDIPTNRICVTQKINESEELP